MKSRFAAFCAVTLIGLAWIGSTAPAIDTSKPNTSKPDTAEAAEAAETVSPTEADTADTDETAVISVAARAELPSIKTISAKPAPRDDDSAADEDSAADDGVADDDDQDTVSGSDQPDHPLAWTIRYASSRSDYIREHVRDYSGKLIKRERINGELQEYQFMRVRMRCEQCRDGQVVAPMSVFMQYLSPAEVRDRRVLYIQGKNDDQVLVRKGGGIMKYLKLKIDPNGNAAKRESNHPITEIGFDKLIDKLVELVEEDMKRDPTGSNTNVEHFLNAKVNDRVCTHIRVDHPQTDSELMYYRASLYVDDELNVPIRLVVYDWPENADEKPPLIEEYTYVDLKLNVGFTDADFSESLLDAKAKRRKAKR